MALRTRQNTTTGSLQTTTSWSPALSGTGVFPTSDQLYWNGVTGMAATLAMGGAINIGGTGGIALGALQTTAVTVDNATAAALTLGTAGLDLSATSATLTIGGTAASVALNANQTWNLKAGQACIIYAPISGAFSINIASGGIWFLTSASSNYSGGTTIGGAVVRIANGAALGTGTIAMTAGSTLSSSTTSAQSLTNALTLNGTMTLGDATNSGTLSFSGTTTVSGTTALTTASAITFSGQLTGTGALTKSGNGDLILTGTTNNNSGAFTASAGTTRLANAASGTPNQLGSVASITISSGAFLFFAGGTTYTQTSSVAGTGTLYVRNTDPSGVTFSGTTSGLTGEFRLYSDSSESGATAQLMTFANWPTSASAAYWINNNTSGNVTQTFKYTGNSIDAGATTPFFVYQGTGTGTPTLTGRIENASTAGKALTLSGAITLSNTGASPTGTLDVLAGASAGTTTLSGAIQEAVSTGTLSFSKGGTGAATLSGANTFKGSVTVSAGTLNANSATALGAASSIAGITVSSPATLSLGAALNYGSPGRSIALSGFGAGTPQAGALLLTTADTSTFSSITTPAATYIRATANATLTSPITNTNGVTFGASSGVSFIPNGIISGAGTVTYGFSSSDTGEVLAYRAHTYTGNTTLAYGVATAYQAEATGSGPFGNKALSTTGTLLMTGGTLRYSSFNQSDYSGRFSTAGNQQWKIDTNSYSVTFATAMTGTGSSLTKSGTGTLLLITANGYDGGTTVTGGTLAFTQTNRLSSVGNITVNGGSLQWEANSTQDYSARLVFQNAGSATVYLNGTDVTFASAIGSSSSSAFTKAGSGTLTLQAANTWSGNTTISTGTLLLSSVASLNSGSYAGTITNNGVLSFASSANQLLSGPINGTGSLIKAGSGTLTLSPTTSSGYAGGTSLTAGKLILGSNTAVGIGTLATSGGVLDVIAAGVSINNLVSPSNNSTLRFSGTGPLTVTGIFAVPATLVTTQIDASSITLNGVVSGSGQLRVWGPGKIVLQNTGNTYAGGTQLISNGVLEFSTNTIPAGALDLNQGTLRWTTGNTQDVSSKITNIGSAFFDTNGNNVTLASSLGNSAPGYVAKTGTGVLTLSGNNSWGTGTQLYEGTIRIANASALGTAGFSISGGSIDAASPGYTVANALSIETDIVFDGTAALTFSTNVALGIIGSSRTITTNGTGGSLTFSGVVSGAGFKLVKAGTNTLKLTNANTYAGGTDITAGTLQAGHVNALNTTGTVRLTISTAKLQTLTNGGQNGKLTVAALTNTAGGIIKIGG